MSYSVADIISFKNVACSATCLGVGNLFLLLAFYEYSVCTIVTYGLTLGLAGGFVMTKNGICKPEAECNAEASIEKAFGVLKAFALQEYNCFKDLFLWTDPYLSLSVLFGSYIALYITDFINLALLVLFLFNTAFAYGYKREQIDKVTIPYCKVAQDKACDWVKKFPRAQAATATQAAKEK